MTNKEFNALLSLLDDPDQDIFQQVEHKLITCGPDVIPLLEESWEESFDPLAQSRIENIVHKIQFDEIKNELQLWQLNNSDDLLDGLMIINRYQYPNMNEDQVYYQLAELRRTAWMGMIYDMSPVEKVRFLNNIIFREFGLSGNTSNYHDPQNSFINQVLETKKGSPISLACIYALVAQKLDLPIYGVNLPKHFVLAYMDDSTPQKALFYINVFNRGQIMKEEDIQAFLRQLNLPISGEYTLPCDNPAIIKRVLRNLISAYEHIDNGTKRNDISLLLELIQ
ncbi:transglutaminase-like domain-containing protein [Sphingobacterium sp. lm-10]|uniref:transglutaminase-like domain-containing protein n=1 Tax=Sphingobacterium sp. lm-10 TaxID=2944904 RepID=UPI0020221884|nr:transglutaminase-like domain-containing protein [Sphingobacterium sp. lm-10]MCL7988120.1 transglutaminase-like domain-containing protein [Sphingobacterium sp. lm-10]